MLYTLSNCLKNKTRALLIALIVVFIAGGCTTAKKSGLTSSANPETGERIITGVSTSDEAGTVKIHIKGNSTLRYTSAKQTSPLGILLYFPGTKLDKGDVDVPSSGNLLGSIKATQQNLSSTTDTRIKVLLNKDVDYEVTREENGIVVTLSTNGSTSVKEGATASVGGEADVKGTDKVAEVKEDKEPAIILSKRDGEKALSSTAVKATKITGVDSKTANGLTNVEIKANGAISDYKVFTLPAAAGKPARIVCDVFNVKRMNIKGEKKIAVNANGVKTVRYSSFPDKTRIVVDTTNEYLKNYKADSLNSGMLIVLGGADKTDTLVAVGNDGTTKNEQTVVAENTSKETTTDKGIVSAKAEPAVPTVKAEPQVASETVISEKHPAMEDKAPESTLENPVAAKMVADVSKEAPKETVSVGNTIPEEKMIAEVTAPEKATTETVEKPVENKEKPVAAEAASTETKADQTPVVEAKVDPATPSGENWVNKIDFVTGKQGKSTVVIGTSNKVKYTIAKKGKKSLQLRLFTTKLPKSRKYPFITTRFDSAVNRIIPVQTRRMKDNVLFIIEMRQAVAYNVDQEDNVIKINFDASTVKPKPESKAGLPAWKSVLSRTSEIGDIEREASGDVAPAPKHSMDMMASKDKESNGGPARDAGYGDHSYDSAKPANDDSGYVSWSRKKKYTGEKIAVDFYETDIKNVFRIIRSVSGQNFAIDKDVTGKVTMTLDKPVPWDQVLDLVLKMNMLGMVSEGGINRIATLETLKQEEEKRLEFIAAEEKTKMKKQALEPLETEYILINYSNADKEIMPLVEKIITPDRGKVTVDKRTNQIILTDTRDKIKEAKGLIRRLDKITPQVIIEARIVEATTSFSRSLGTEWSLSSNPNFDNYSDALGGTYGYAVAMNNTVASDSSIGINFTKLTGAQFLLNAKLLAMESRGEGKIVSAPKVLTMDNKEATIIQGVEIPFATVSSEGTQTTFKKIELKLAVTPHVTADNKISLKVLIDKNDVGGVTNLGPTITTKKVESELLIADGDTIVIGGIIKSNKSVTDSGVPFVSDLPIVGWLFKSRIRSEDKQELLVFLSPRVVSYEETER